MPLPWASICKRIDEILEMPTYKATQDFMFNESTASMAGVVNIGTRFVSVPTLLAIL